MDFSCNDSPRNRPNLDSGDGGQDLGGGVDGGVNGALCIAKKWPGEKKILSEKRDLIWQTTRTEKKTFPSGAIWMALFDC